MVTLINVKDIKIISFDNIWMGDYPDFCDAYISEAEYKSTGEKLTESELDELNTNYNSFVYESLLDWIY